MKVTLEKDYKSIYTIEEYESAKRIIAWEKENDEETVKGWAEYAVREALKDEIASLTEVIKAEARTAKNSRIWDAYGEGTGRMDVWIEFVARTSEGYMDGGAYLSDIWQTGADDYRPHMYIRRFVEA